jgi:hypothetical protein
MASNHLILDTNILVEPDHADPLARDFQIQQSSPAMDAGTPVPVFVDFVGTPRPAGSRYGNGRKHGEPLDITHRSDEIHFWHRTGGTEDDARNRASAGPRSVH